MKIHEMIRWFAGDLRRHAGYCDVIVMFIEFCSGLVPLDFIYIIQVTLLAPTVVPGLVKRSEIMWKTYVSDIN